MLRSGESCGFYKSSNGESYQNELTGVRNWLLTPVLRLWRCKTKACTGIPLQLLWRHPQWFERTKLLLKTTLQYILLS